MSNEEFVRLGLRAAVWKVKLMENELTAIGVSLKHGRIDAEGVMQWLHEEGLMFLMPEVFERRLNRYVCDKCGIEVITVEPGVGRVPYELKCRTTLSTLGFKDRICDGFARSQFYDVPIDAVPTWEFFSPQVSDIHSWFDRWRYTNNQLFIRRIDG